MKIKRIEKASMIALSVMILWSAWSGSVMNSIQTNMTRLHVIADSDTAEAQALKLKVRDRVLETATVLTSECKTSDEAREVIVQNLSRIQDEASNVVKDNGYDLPVRTQLDTEYYPIRHYDTFSLPSGDYTSLKVIIGEGKGKNWWCVLFPPLCIAAAEGTASEYAEYTGLTESDWRLLESAEDGYEVRFLLLDLFSRLKHNLSH